MTPRTPSVLLADALSTALRGAPYMSRLTIAPRPGTIVSRITLPILNVYRMKRLGKDCNCRGTVASDLFRFVVGPYPAAVGCSPDVGDHTRTHRKGPDALEFHYEASVPEHSRHPSIAASGCSSPQDHIGLDRSGSGIRCHPLGSSYSWRLCRR